MAQTAFKKVGFAVGASLLLMTFPVAFMLSVRALNAWSGWGGALAFTWALLAFSVNALDRIFLDPLFGRQPRNRDIGWLIVLDLALFQACALPGVSSNGFAAWYYRHILPIQLSNLLLLWVCICALKGQRNFHPFVVDFFSRPFYALGRLASRGY